MYKSQKYTLSPLNERGEKWEKVVKSGEKLEKNGKSGKKW